VNLQLIRWQLGVKYIAQRGGDTKLDGRYLASVDSSNANIAFIRDEELPKPVIEPAKAASVGVVDAPGLVILKHRPEEPFDLARFAQDPTQFVEDFDRLSRDEDGDDWNAKDRLEGKLATHFEKEDLFIVRTQGGAKLDIQWGDMPMADFFKDYLAVEPDAEGCYSSLSTALVNEDGTPVQVPHRMFWCPKESVALFDIADGYEVGLTATFKDARVDETRAGTSIRDNFRLYAKEVYPRSPRARATGSVKGNIGASFRDAGSDTVDMFRYAVIGTQGQNIHTGQKAYEASPVTAVPRAIFDLVRLKPLDAVGELLTGVDSAISVGASAMSAVGNAVVNPLVQVTVGNAMSPQAADTTGHWVGALSLAAAKNLPGAERNIDAISPIAQWQHNRGYAQLHYTRTDSQLNIDRIMTLIDAVAIAAISRHNDGGGNSGPDDMDNNGGGGGGGGGGVTPPGNGHGRCKFPKKFFKKKFVKKHQFKKKIHFRKKIHFKKKINFKKKVGFKKKIHFKKPAVYFKTPRGRGIGIGHKFVGHKKSFGHVTKIHRCYSRLRIG
jgi:hypothetical protein